MNSIYIVCENGKSKIYLNGTELRGVIDYQIKKTSAQSSAEVAIIFDTSKFQISFKE